METYRVGSIKHISTEIEQILRNIFNKRDPILAELIFNWSKIVGLKFARCSYPFKITKGRENCNTINTLHIQVDDPCLSMEIAFQQGIMIERIAVYFGFKPIHKFKVIAI